MSIFFQLHFVFESAFVAKPAIVKCDIYFNFFIYLAYLSFQVTVRVLSILSNALIMLI